MNIPNQGQIQYISDGLLKNVRQDGRVNTQRRLVHLKKGILMNCLGSCYLEDEDNKIYSGIKMELVNPLKDSPKEGIITVSVESMKRRNISQSLREQNVDKDKLSFIQSYINNYYLNFINKSSLSLIEGKKCWSITIDVFVLNYVDESQLEKIMVCINQSLLDLQIPQLKITHNLLTNEDVFEIIGDKFDQISNSLSQILQEFELPELFVVGQIDKCFIFDLTFDEFYSVQQKYVVVSMNKRVQMIREFESNEQGILPEDIMNLYARVSG